MQLNFIWKKIMESLYDLKNTDIKSNEAISKGKKLNNRNDANDINSSQYLFVCKICHEIPEIKFLNILSCEYDCDCFHIINIKPEHCLNIFSTHLNKEQNKILEENVFCICKKHLKNYVAYCDDCASNLCEGCFCDNIHLNHTTITFPNICDKLKNLIFNYINFEMKKMENNDNKENISSIAKLLELIVLSYKNSHCFNSFKNLYNLFDFLEKINNNEKKLNMNKKENIKMEFFLKIKQPIYLKDFLKKFPKDTDKIESIIIPRYNFYDLKLLKLNELPSSYNNLIILDLRNNNISDISPLISINFPELKILDISINRLSNESIGNINDLSKNCLKLETLNLFNNNFTEYKLLKTVESFKCLKALNVGNNVLQTDFKSIKNENLTFDLANIEDLGLSFSVFSKQSINLIKNMKLNNLKKLDLSSNKLTSLSFVDLLNNNELEEISLSDNHLKEFDKLKKFQKLKLINLEGNKISDITKLNDFLNDLPNIEKIILSKNTINLYNLQNYEIIEKAKQHRNSTNNKIQIIINNYDI